MIKKSTILSIFCCFLCFFCFGQSGNWYNKGNVWRDLSHIVEGRSTQAGVHYLIKHSVEVSAAASNWLNNGYIVHNGTQLGYGSGVLAAADENGIVYNMNSAGQIYKWHIPQSGPKVWQYITGSGLYAQDFAVGGNRVYIIKQNNGGNGLVYRWEGANNWQQMYWGTGVKLAAGIGDGVDDDNLWLINDWNRVYKFTRQGNSGWTEIIGQHAKDIAIFYGRTYILGTDNKVYEYNKYNSSSNKWELLTNTSVPTNADKLVVTYNEALQRVSIYAVANSQSNSRQVYEFVPANLRVAAGSLQTQSNVNSISTKTLLKTTTDLPENFSIKFYPNPILKDINLAIYSPIATNAQVLIFDIKGTEVLSNKENLVVGENSLSKDLSGFNPGVYFIKVIAPGRSVYQKKFVIRGN